MTQFRHLPSAPMRRIRSSLAIILAAGVLASCGGSDVASPPEPPPPTIVDPPAALRLLAGDQQVAEPGARVAVAPAVMVVDARDRAVAGVSVQFTVDSGGGTVTGATVTTGSDGVAAVGSWRLGTTEGPQHLVATAGTLPPVRVRATARVAAVTLPDEPLPSGGSPLIFRRPGLPGDSVTLSVSTGALGTAARVALRVASSTSVVMPAGWRAASPLFQVIPVGGVQSAPIALAVPGDVAGPDPVLLVAWDAATGRLAVLPTIGRTDRQIAALVNPSTSLTWYAPPSTAASRSPLAATARAPHLAPVIARQSLPDPAGSPPAVLMIRIDRSMLNSMYDTGFRPEQDQWPFDDRYVVLAPPFDGVGLAPREAFVAPAMTSIWYYLYQRAGGPLRTRFTEAAGVAASTRMGLKWTAGVEQALPPATQPRMVLLRDNAFLLPQSTLEQYWGVTALFGLSRNAPQPVALFDDASATDSTIATVGIAYRTRLPAAGSGELLLDVAVPGSNEGMVTMRARAEGWAPVTVTYGPSRVPVTFTGLNVLPAGGGFADAILDATWPLVQSETFGTTGAWPQLRLLSAFGELDPADVVLLDTLQHWWECDNCPVTTYRQSAVVPHRATLRPFSLFRRQDAGWIRGDALVPSMRFSAASVSAAPTVTTAGMIVWQPGDGSGADLVRDPTWIDWRTVRYRRLPTTIAPSGEVNASRDTSITFTVSALNPPTGPLRYRWLLRGADGTGGDSTETSTPTWSRQFSEGTDRWVVVTILQGTGKRPIGRDSVRVRVEDYAAWRLETFTLTPLHACDWTCDFLAEVERVAQQPSRGVLRVFRVARTPFGWPTFPTQEGLYPTPSVWLDGTRGVADPAPDRWQPDVYRTIAVAHTFAGTAPTGNLVGTTWQRADGALQFTGSLRQGSLQGWSNPPNLSANGGMTERYDVAATWNGEIIEGTLEWRAVTTITRNTLGRVIPPGTVWKHVRIAFRGRRIPSAAARP